MSDCSCTGTYVPPTTSCPTTCTCLDLGTITVFPDDGVAPCGQTGVISFTDCFDFCACLNEVATLSVVDVTPTGKITINTINQSGLSYTTTSDANANDKITVTIKAVCNSAKTSGLQLGDYTTITIYIKDLCKGVVPGVGQSCDKCTGLLVDDINLTVN